MNPQEGVGQKGLTLGLDAGSVSLNTVVLGPDGAVLWHDYTRTKGRPLQAALRVLEEAFSHWERQNFSSLALTGAGAQILAACLGGLVVNEIIALTQGVAACHPEARTIIDMGGEDAKMILTAPAPGGGLAIEDFAMNTMCAAGTGSFLDQQSNRLQLTIEEFSEVSLKSQSPPRLAGRCSVFAKSDMIHLQQEATPDYDIVAGLCYAMARNLKSNIAKGKYAAPPVAFTGGVAANQGVRRALGDILELKDGGLIVPELYACLGARGAALHALALGHGAAIPPLEGLAEKAAQGRGRAVRLERLTLSPEHGGDPRPMHRPDGVVPAYLGVDVGSISTNLVVIDESGRVLSRQYLMTAGKPLEAVKQGLRLVGRELGGQVEIKGAGTTGSGRYLTADFIGADIVRNEITAQATAAAFIDPQVDTIFEIGGQDSKYISLKDGAIVDFTMNKVCAAGTGSFLEEQAEKLGISIKDEFGKLALASQSPVRMGERCTVFMESDLVAHQAAGEPVDDLVAGLSYSIVHNYLNKVVEDRRIGERIFFQGGPAANQGIVAAFEAVLQRPVTVPPHHDVTGAMGAALLAMRERTWQESSFKGFEAAETGYEISTFECQGCPNTCTIRKVKVAGQKRPLFYGSRCEKYDVDKSAAAKDSRLPDLFAEREALLTAHLGPPRGKSRGRIGIPRTMYFRELLPFFSAYLRELGFEPVVSPVTNKTMIHRGVEVMVNEPCFPLKAAHGHLLELMDQGLERIFFPSVVNMPAPGHELGYGLVCPYAQTLPYTMPAALDFAGRGVELITSPVRLGFGERLMRRDFKRLTAALGAPARLTGRAIAAGQKAQDEFAAALKKRGQEVLAAMAPEDLAMVVVSRPYNGADPGINLGLPQKISGLGALALPLDFLDLDAEMGRADLGEMYWRYGQKILAAAHIVRNHPQLFGVYITNFGCGPDSFIGHFFNQIMIGKPHLEIEIDEHSADVGAITRLEAFLDSLKNAPAVRPPERAARRRTVAQAKRTLYVPPMSDHSQAVAAAFRACGVDAHALPDSDKRTLELGRKYTSGKECFPCALTTGDMLKKLMDNGSDPGRAAFFMPSGTGPCRFGQYHRFHRMVLDELGYQDVPIYAPDQSETLYQDLGVMGGEDFPRLGWQGLVAVDYLQKALHETRPHEAGPGASDAVYGRHLKEVCQVIEQRGDLALAMARAREDFAGIARKNGTRRPLVGVVGEIYTRANRFANEEVVRSIEELGGQAWLPTIGEWILYINFTGSRRAQLLKRYRDYLGMRLEEFFQLRDEHHLGRPWRGYLQTLDEPPVRRILKMAGSYLDDSYEGEAILSMGKSQDMLKKGISGVVNVIPFGCMPGTIVNALMKKFREDCRQIPFLPMAMDGQAQSGGRIRLEAFMHQVSQYRDARE